MTALSLDDSGPTILVGGVLVVFGLVAVMPWLVQAAGRLAARLPLPLRLSVRDAARHRVRTACAAAAVMAATMGAISLGIGAESQDAAFKASYRPEVPTGTLTITARSVDDRGWADLRAAATKALPGVSLISGQRCTHPRRPGVVDARAGAAGRAMASAACRRSRRSATRGLLAPHSGTGDPQAAAALARGQGRRVRRQDWSRTAR